MSKTRMEQLETSIVNLLEAYRKLKDERRRLTVLIESLTSEQQSFLKEEEIVKKKLERLSELESANSNNENDRIQIREKVVQVLQKLEKFDLT